MARGYVYEIEGYGSFMKDDFNQIKDCLHNMDETDFYDLVPYEADYFSDLESEEAKSEVRECLERLKKYGFEIGKTVDPEDPDIKYPWFKVTQAAKENYFQARYEKVKKIVKSMTLEEFSKDVGELESTIDDNYNDAVYLDGETFYSFDDFVRHADIRRKYYIGNVVLMH